MGSSRDVALVISLDDGFVAPARALLESIRQFGGVPDNASLVVLTRSLSEASVRALDVAARRAHLKLSVHTIRNIDELGAIPQWAVPTSLRLYAGDVCSEFARALYLDADLLVLGDLKTLFDCDLGDSTVAAVLNHPPLDVMRVAIRRSQRGDVNSNAGYFNAGVLLIDTRRWSERGVGQRARAFLKRYPETRLLDQDALNIALAEDWLMLPHEWNVPAGPLDDAPLLGGMNRLSPSLAQKLESWKLAQGCPRILHFTGRPKPWEGDYPWPELRDRYRQFILADDDIPWPASVPHRVISANGESRIREFWRGT